jgi:hypothetical protein
LYQIIVVLPTAYAFGDQEPFREKVPGPPKAFYNKKFLQMLHGVQGGQFFQKASPLAAGGRDLEFFSFFY